MEIWPDASVTTYERPLIVPVDPLPTITPPMRYRSPAWAFVRTIVAELMFALSMSKIELSTSAIATGDPPSVKAALQLRSESGIVAVTTTLSMAMSS